MGTGITPKQAKALAAKGQKIKQQEWSKWAKEEKAKKAKEHRQLKAKVPDFMQRCYDNVKHAAKNGETQVQIYLSYEDEKLVRFALPKLRQAKFEVSQSHDTVFTGVDEWTENKYLLIKW